MWSFVVGLLVGSSFVVAFSSVVIRRVRRESVQPAEVPNQGSTSAEEAVADDSSRLREVLDALPLGVIVWGAGGKELFRNQRVASMAGLTHAAVLVEEAADRLLVSALDGAEVEEQVSLAGPPQRVFVVRAMPLVHAGAVATVEDVTERWRLDRVRTDFVANVSHELKTPVGAISVLAETLEGESTDEVVIRLTGRMIGETQRMARTIDDLLELSRIEMGGEMETGPVDLGDVSREAIERVQESAARHCVAVTLEIRDGSVTVDGDHFQLVSALGNLVENAVKYGRSGGSVEVVIRPGSDDVEVDVVDHGIGIPPASIDRIFERFYRVDRARSRETGGTGLGLAIVRHVVTNHGGEVNVRSREGEGSTFTLRIPRRVGPGTVMMDSNEECESRHG